MNEQIENEPDFLLEFRKHAKQLSDARELLINSILDSKPNGIKQLSHFLKLIKSIEFLYSTAVCGNADRILSAVKDVEDCINKESSDE